MKTNQAGLDLIKSFEGCVLVGYLDQAGVATIGYGHTGPEVVEGMYATQEMADTWLAQDLQGAERAVSTMLRVLPTQNQFAALVSFCFNLGAGALRGSTLMQMVNRGDPQDAADQFLKWDHIHIDGQLVESAGLKRRRAAERELFLTP